MTALMSVLVAFALAGGPLQVLDSGDDPAFPRLTLPDGKFPPPSLPGVQAPANPSPPAPSDRGQAVEPAPAPNPVEARKSRVDELFKRLAAAKDAQEAAALSAIIDRVWMQSGSDTADLLMSRALKAVDGNDYKLAESLLDKIVALQPDWAEAWNKRATVHYLDDDDEASMEDISHVLAIEPRHYGALSGMGFILHRNGDDKAALTVLRRVLAIDPQNSSVKTMVKDLAPEVEGRDL